MTIAADIELLQKELHRQGLVVLEADLPFLLRTFHRQRHVVDSWKGLVDPTTEPAHVFIGARLL
jgi:hypothetical protein